MFLLSLLKLWCWKYVWIMLSCFVLVFVLEREFLMQSELENENDKLNSKPFLRLYSVVDHSHGAFFLMICPTMESSKNWDGFVGFDQQVSVHAIFITNYISAHFHVFKSSYCRWAFFDSCCGGCGSWSVLVLMVLFSLGSLLSNFHAFVTNCNSVCSIDIRMNSWKQHEFLRTFRTLFD